MAKVGKKNTPKKGPKSRENPLNGLDIPVENIADMGNPCILLNYAGQYVVIRE